VTSPLRGNCVVKLCWSRLQCFAFLARPHCAFPCVGRGGYSRESRQRQAAPSVMWHGREAWRSLRFCAVAVRLTSSRTSAGVDLLLRKKLYVTIRAPCSRNSAVREGFWIIGLSNGAHHVDRAEVRRYWNRTDFALCRASASFGSGPRHAPISLYKH